MCTRLQVYIGATDQRINKYRAIFRAALNGEAPAMLLDARDTYVSCLNPSLCAPPPSCPPKGHNLPMAPHKLLGKFGPFASKPPYQTRRAYIRQNVTYTSIALLRPAGRCLALAAGFTLVQGPRQPAPQLEP